ncbi:MAG: PCYCGC motif-containing (lipo)protein [Bacilli bacterium]
MKKWLIVAFSAVLFVSGCSKTKDEHAGHAHGNSQDIREETQSADVLPSFLDGQTDLIRASYKVAAQYTEVLEYMPCYCGCGESVGHKSNLDCFIKEVSEDGSIVWDSHAITCNVCIEIGVTSAKLASEGKSVKEIRTIIDETYNSGYAEPTPTPDPA